jgi:G:T-mismatch repair DNA endonuclease (very short patch repair protein)
MYELLNKENWHTCKITGKKIKDLAKVYGGSGVYYNQVFEKYLKEEHNITLTDYFTIYCNEKQKYCSCNICNQKSIVIKSKIKSGFKWQEYICGRNEGLLKWSEEAKESRKGSGNPMFNKIPWNNGKNKETCQSIKNMSEKQKGKKISDDSKLKMSISAKKRKIHGNSGNKHSEESKQKMRYATLKRIENGDFKQTKTKPHIAFSNILDSLHIKYKEETILSKWSFDFYLVEYDIYVEIDGDYFHSNPKIYPYGPKTKTQKINWYRDIKKNKYCEENNIKLIRFWECDILNNEEFIKCKMKELLELNLLVR